MDNLFSHLDDICFRHLDNICLSHLNNICFRHLEKICFIHLEEMMVALTWKQWMLRWRRWSVNLWWEIWYLSQNIFAQIVESNCWNSKSMRLGSKSSYQTVKQSNKSTIEKPLVRELATLPMAGKGWPSPIQAVSHLTRFIKKNISKLFQSSHVP